MIKHIVMFKVRETGSVEEKMQLVDQLKNALEALPRKIEQIQTFEVGVNISESPGAYDLILVSTFQDMDELAVYRDHPEHQKVVELIKKETDNRVVVDYEI